MTLEVRWSIALDLNLAATSYGPFRNLCHVGLTDGGPIRSCQSSAIVINFRFNVCLGRR